MLQLRTLAWYKLIIGSLNYYCKIIIIIRSFNTHFLKITLSIHTCRWKFTSIPYLLFKWSVWIEKLALHYQTNLRSHHAIIFYDKMESLSPTKSTTNSSVEFIIDYFNKNTQET